MTREQSFLYNTKKSRRSNNPLIVNCKIIETLCCRYKIWIIYIIRIILRIYVIIYNNMYSIVERRQTASLRYKTKSFLSSLAILPLYDTESNRPNIACILLHLNTPRPKCTQWNNNKVKRIKYCWYAYIERQRGLILLRKQLCHLNIL